MRTMDLCLVLSLAFCGCSAFSQESDENPGLKFGFNAGISHCQVKELNLNGLVHSGPGFNLAAVCSNHRSTSVRQLELMADLNFLKTGFEPETGSYLIQISARYSVAAQVAKQNERFALYFGGQVKLQAVQGIYTNWDVNHFYWLTSYSLGINSIAIYEISEKSGFSIEMGLPLISFISRTPERNYIHEANPGFQYILSQIHRNPSFEFPLNHFSPEVRLAYHRNIGKKTIQSIFWRCHYVDNHVANSGKIRIMDHSLGIGFLF